MSYKGVTLLQIEYFLAVAKYLNFTEAAKHLYTSQPSLSKQISQMEKKLGVNLFYRTKRDVRLTAEGITLYTEIDGITEQIDDALKSCINPILKEGCAFRIGCYEVMDTGIFLKQIISNFVAEYPDIDVILERHSFSKLRQKLEQGDLDVILTLSFDVEDQQGIDYDEIYKSNSCVLMSSNHFLAKRDGLTLSDFREETFVLLDREESPRGYDSIIRLCRNNGFTPRKIKLMPNVESQLLTIESGKGITIINDNLRLFRKHNFKRHLLEDDFISVIMAWKVENFSPTVAIFNRFVLEHINR